MVGPAWPVGSHWPSGLNESRLTTFASERSGTPVLCRGSGVRPVRTINRRGSRSTAVLGVRKGVSSGYARQDNSPLLPLVERGCFGRWMSADRSATLGVRAARGNRFAREVCGGPGLAWRAWLAKHGRFFEKWKGHAWLTRFDKSTVDLGSGKRVQTTNGRLASI